MGDQGDASGAQEKFAVLRAVRSPLGFLTFAAIVCDGVFVVAATLKNNQETIVFTMHMFLAIVGSVVLIALWSPRSLYHPQDLKGVPPADLIDDKGRWVVTIVLGLALLAYMAYRIIKDTNIIQLLLA